MTATRDPDRLIRAFLLEGAEQLADQVYDVVRADIDTKQQRAFVGPWRLPTMNKLVPIGLGAAAAVVAIVAGAQLLGTPAPTVGPAAAATATPLVTAAVPSNANPTSPPDDSLPPGPFLMSDPSKMPPPHDDGPRITVTIAAPGWTSLSEFGALQKGDQADPPVGTGAALLQDYAKGYYVYGDPCKWQSTTPDSPAKSVDAFVDALAAQPSRGATTPVDVTVGGYRGKHLTLHVPSTAKTRAELEQDCDETTFASWAKPGGDGPSRWHQGPGQIDELWVLDLDGGIVILDATYGPATPPELVEELRRMAESATFE